MGKIKVLVVLVILVFAALQFFQPEKTNPETDSSLVVAQQIALPAEIAVLIGTSCRDCHTHDTIWPMHSYISPVSWLVDYDVTHGRESLNFSLWGHYKPQTAWMLLDTICKQITTGGMPPSRYLLVHREARLDDKDKETICSWTEKAKALYE